VKIFLVITSIVFLSTAQCGKKKDIVCKKQFYECASNCSNICGKTIKRDYEFGKCFSTCTKPCRKDYCYQRKMTGDRETKIKIKTNKDKMKKTTPEQLSQEQICLDEERIKEQIDKAKEEMSYSDQLRPYYLGKQRALEWVLEELIKKKPRS
jgi:hypothetical protein